MKQFVIETYPQVYRNGVFYRKGNRVYMNKDTKPPTGIQIMAETKRIESIGVSYEVVSWTETVEIK